MYKEFELQKVCYLPLNAFLLKPIQRLVHYRLLLSRLCGHYEPGHRDYADCRGECGPDRQEPVRPRAGVGRVPEARLQGSMLAFLLGTGECAAFPLGGLVWPQSPPLPPSCRGGGCLSFSSATPGQGSPLHVCLV